LEPHSSQDAEHLKLLALFHYIVAAMMALLASFPILHLTIGLAMVSGKFGTPKHGEFSPDLFGWFFVLIAGGAILTGWTLAVCTLVAGRSLAHRKRYLFCLVVAGIMAVTCMPFGTVLGVFTIIVLIRPSVKQLFEVLPEGGAA
jgi:hypothetical protein